MINIFRYIGYFLATVGAVTAIWKLALFFDARDDNTHQINDKLETIVYVQTKQKAQNDSILRSLGLVRNDLNNLITSQNSLRSSYILFLSKQPLTKEEFLLYMEGIQFELKKKNEMQGTSLFQIPYSLEMP